jgi:hypothetical protein
VAGDAAARDVVAAVAGAVDRAVAVAEAAGAVDRAAAAVNGDIPHFVVTIGD